MVLTDEFVLPQGVLLQPLDELAPALRRHIRGRDGSFTLSRVNARTQTKLLDRETAELVNLFVEPTTIARAVARFTYGKDCDPEQVLEQALPLLQSLIAEGLLAKAGSAEAGRLEPSLHPGRYVDGWKVLRCVQTTEDVELYQLRDGRQAFAALKIGRLGVTGVKAALERESRLLSVAGDAAPRVLVWGEWDGRPYLLTTWVRGANAQTAFSEHLEKHNSEARVRLRDLGTAMLSAYARLHERGVVHGDVHPRNVLIGLRNEVVLVDFGLAACLRRPENTARRGGVGFFYEPEFALQAISGGSHPLTPLGEQYSVGAMLYLLVTGSHYLDFRLERDPMLRQIAEEPVVPFERRGIEPWPAAERVLARALKKRPGERFASMREFRDAWAGIEIPEPAREATGFETLEKHDIVESVLAAATVNGEYAYSESPPTCSVNHGAAGVAAGLCRIAAAVDSGEALALADVWARQAILREGEPGAYDSAELQVDATSADAASPYHGPGGAQIAQATVAAARGDVTTLQASARRYAELCEKASVELDLTFGRSGALLGAALLYELLRDAATDDALESNSLRSGGDKLLDILWQSITPYRRISESDELTHLGVAHGWAGLLYATCCWSAATGTPLPGAFTTRARELAECAEPIDRGLRWRWGTGAHGDTYMPGWCNGSAGYVFLWDEAYRITRDGAYLDLAEGAAWNVWEAGVGGASLCCGAAGQGYALLRWFRRCGDRAWLRRAHDVADRGVRTARLPHDRDPESARYWHPGSLYKGDVGVAALVADLARPEYARMPVFELQSRGDDEA